MVGAAVAGASPTGSLAGDVLVPAIFAGAVTFAGSRARRWSMVVVTAGAAVLASAGWLWALALVALGAALAQVLIDRRDRVAGAAIVAAAVQVLLRTPALEPDGVSAVVLLALTTPVLVSGYRAGRREERRVANRLAAVVGLAAALASLAFVVTALEGRADLDRGVDLGQRGLEALRAGDTDEAADLLERSASAFRSAEADLTSPFAQPARLLPVVGPQANASRQIAKAGGELSAAARIAAEEADFRNLGVEDGVVDLEGLAAMEDPAADAHRRLVAASELIAGIETTGLLPPVADPVRSLGAELDDTVRQAQTVIDGLDAAPWLLGAEAPRRYFLAFGQPAESRGLGGFVGSYGILTVDGGRIELEHSGRIGELETAPGWESRTLSGPPDYLARYGRYYPTRYLKNATASPDFPTVAGVLEELYPQAAGGAEIDGVIYLDPFALADLLELTGPVEVDGLDEPLSAENAADLLLKQQYVRYPETPDRADVLAAAAEAVFAALTEGTALRPGELADTLAPSARKGRLLFSVTDPAADDVLAQLGVGGRLPAPDGGDFLSVRTANAAANKLDPYLARTIDYQPAFDPATGAVDATLTVTLENRAPANLPDYVAGNADLREGAPGAPPAGTNIALVSVYSGLGLTQARVGGEALPVEVQQELGRSVYTLLVEIPQGESVTIEMDLSGSIEAGERYRLTLAQQPLVVPDAVAVELEGQRGAAVAPGQGRWEVAPADAVVRLDAEVTP